MAKILITDLTNKTEAQPGTGVFDIMMEAAELHLKDEYGAGRITGEDYSTVYLGAMQSILQQSIQFLLTEQEADKKAELVSKQVIKAEEEIDLVIGETARAYESIKASQDKTLRDNLLNNSTVAKVNEETDLLKSKDLEQIADTARKSAELEVKLSDANMGIGIKAQQEYTSKDKNGGATVTYTYYIDGVSGATTTTTNLGAVLGPVLGTTVADGIGDSTVSLEKEILKSKDLLIDAQTLGFASDTKQKLLKQMMDGYTAVLSITNLGAVPDANVKTAIDAVANELLDDVGSLVNI